MPQQPEDLRTLTTPPGGIMTNEVGAITGPVETWIQNDQVLIRYAGALDTYTVGAASGRTIDEVVAILTTDPGIDQYGNPAVADLPDDQQRVSHIDKMRPV